MSRQLPFPPNPIIYFVRCIHILPLDHTNDTMLCTLQVLITSRAIFLQYENNNRSIFHCATAHW